MCINIICIIFLSVIVCVFVPITGCCTGSQPHVAVVSEESALVSRFCPCWLCLWPTSTSSSSLNPQAPSLPQTSQRHLLLKLNRGSGAKQATPLLLINERLDLSWLRANLNLCLRMFNPTVISFFHSCSLLS